MSRQDRIYDILRKTLFLEVVILVLIISGCYPPAASMQDARMVGKGGARLTGYWYGLEDAGYSFVSIGPKFGLSEDRLDLWRRARDPHAAVTTPGSRRITILSREVCMAMAAALF
jgi:hypothetical protein